MSASDSKVRLCLHFDINKSIIMTDASSGRSMDQTLNSLLSECTWGFCEDRPLSERSENDWKVCHLEPSCEPPVSGSITLGTYLEDHTLVPKKEQTRIKRAFTDSGSLGEVFRPYHAKLNAALRIPGNADTAGLSVLASGYYHLLPSFFRLVEYLAEEKIEFNILFRTFGVDIDNVCEEFNLFCTGKHPLFVPKRLLDGTDPTYPKDLRIHLPYFHGRISHTEEGPDGIHMTYRAPDEVERRITGAEAVFHTIMRDWFNIDTEGKALSKGADMVASATSPHPQHQHQHTHCAALQDDFHWWHTVNDESETSGKLLLVDAAADFAPAKRAHSGSNGGDVPVKKQNRLIQVFFDDNIERTRAHIVDVRDCHSFAPVPFSASQGRYLRRVEPYLAILDREYYVKQVQDVLKLYASQQG